MGVRRESVNRQSPGLAESAMGAFESQLAQLTKNRKTTKSRQGDSDDLVVYELMKRRGNEQAHHKGILETLDLLYRGLDDKEVAELTAYANQYGSIGNSIGNLINMPMNTHQGGIHKYARDKGYEYHPNTKNPTGFVQDIIEASEMPLEYRKHVLKKYLTEAVPDMNNHINDLLTADPSMQEKLDLSSVREAVEQERMAGKAMNTQMMRDYLNEAGEDVMSTGSVVGQKPFVINADEGANVYVHTNGNANDHAMMQQAFNRRRRSE